MTGTRSNGFFHITRFCAVIMLPWSIRSWVTSTASSGNLLLVFLRCVLIFVGNRVEPPSADTRSETENIEPILHRIISRKMLGYLVLYGLDGGSSKLRRPTGSAFFSRNRRIARGPRSRDAPFEVNLVIMLYLQYG